jgi:hypothetical protein
MAPFRSIEGVSIVETLEVPWLVGSSALGC